MCGMGRPQVQYHPRVDSVSPLSGSLAGGTVVTIEGGGFPMDEEDAEISVGGRACVVTYASLEKLVCNTTQASNATVATKVDRGPASNAPAAAWLWMDAVEVAGNWTEVPAPPPRPPGSGPASRTGPVCTSRRTRPGRRRGSPSRPRRAS